MDEATVQRLFQLQRETYVFEDIIRAVYQSLLQSGDVAIDGGANIGDHTLPMAQCVGSSGRVYAYEPVPATVQILKTKLASAQATQVDVRTKALGSKPGQSSFVWVENRATRSSLKSPNLMAGARTSQIHVEVVTLDSELEAETRPVRFIKLDLEGGEYDCLRGALAVLARHRPAIVFENGSETTAKNYGYTSDDFFALFTHNGYQLLDLFGRPYKPEHWGARNVPYYTFAVPSGNEAAVAAVANDAANAVAV